VIVNIKIYVGLNTTVLIKLNVSWRFVNDRKTREWQSLLWHRKTRCDERKRHD